MDTQNTLHENISALADGELPQSEQELALAALGTADGQAAWCAYHLIGDVLRDGAQGALSDGFNARLTARLAQLPDDEAPRYGVDGSGPGTQGVRSAHGLRGDGSAAANPLPGAAPASGLSPLPEDQAEPRADVILP